ncbi:hypothetical protein J2W30_003631 [Variovorax boronicumulans]|uniref:hypothetical protein n=1 Tax=Variovorax boronicumulans TaxID=436515 RepID=UPI0027876152|nr:hypothetical protein [Variovorax boronicumulans]MDQ0035863.1 hypothetical protein [Variovorax boronicumulans]
MTKPIELMPFIEACCVEEGDCLIWTWGREKIPQISLGRSKINVRALVLFAQGVDRIDGTMLGCSCGNRKCVAPAHIRQRSHLQHAQYFGNRGAYSGPAKTAKMAATKRAKSKLDDEKVAAIRASTKSAKALSAEFGVAASYITSIRAGLLWKDYSSPFAGLGARA